MSYFGIPIRNGLPIGLGSVAPLASGGGSPFSPLSLFSGGAPGVWYDPSDYTTLFQDSAGTTPVTAVEQPVGLMLDKSQGLVLGSEQSPALSAYATLLTGTWVASGANYVFTDTVGGQSRPGVQWPSASLAPGWYQLVVVVSAITGATQIRADGLGATDQLLTVGTNYRIVNVTSTSLPRFRLEDLSTTIGDGFTITSISVKQLAGNHAFQATSASRPVLSARYNLLTKTEQFDDAAWTKSAATITANTTATTDPLGGNTADKLQETTASAFHYAEVAPGVTVGASYTVSFYAKAAERTWCSVFGAGKAPSYFDLSNGVTGTAAANTTISMQNVGNGWYRCFYTATAANTPDSFGITSATGNNQGAYIGTTGSGIYIWGASLVPSNQSTLPYQRVNTATDYNTTGFLPYLKFDGVDDSLSTNSISFTSTDKMSVFAGVRKLSDAARGMLVELSTAATQAGTFAVTAPNASAASNYATIVTGSAVNIRDFATYTAPISNVLAINMFSASAGSGAEVATRINGVSVAGTTGPNFGASTGNFGNWPLFIGRRNNASLPFNGQMYSMIIVGKAVTAGELSSTEAYVNQKTGAY